MLPVQDNPSPVNPALHVQVKEPMVFWQTALASQGEERHSSISVKYKSLRLNKKKKNIYNNNKGPLGLPFLNFYQTDPRLAGSRRQHNSVSDEETLFDPPSVRSWLPLPPPECTLWCKSPGTSSARCFMPFCGRKNFIAMLTCGWNRCCRWHCKLNKM